MIKRYTIRNSPLYICKNRGDIFGQEYLQHRLQTSDNIMVTVYFPIVFKLGMYMCHTTPSAGMTWMV